MADESEIDVLMAAIRACRICRDAPIRGEAYRLPHEPRPVAVISATAKVLIAGQAPGLRVHASGKPFTDASGDRLRHWLGVSGEEFYDPSRFAIVPMGFCFPGYDTQGSDLPPRRECAPVWRSRVMAAMPQIELVLAVGHHAQKWHMGDRAGPTMTATVENWRAGLGSNVGPAVLPLPHPSWRNTGWLNRHPWFEAELLPVLRERVTALIA